MKRAVLLQCCIVTAFVEGFYCIVLQERQSVMIDLISHLIENKSACFSLNMVLDVFRYSDSIYLPFFLSFLLAFFLSFFLYYIPLYLTDMEQFSNLMQHIKHLSVMLQ